MTLFSSGPQTCITALFARFGRFRRDDDGGMIVFSLILFILILTCGGMAVDYMRFETTRAQLQATLDRASLAAADLDQTQPPRDVVIDYFTKAGMIEYLQYPIEVDEGINYRTVAINAQVEMPLFFLDLPRVFMAPFSPGMRSLTVTGASSAEERVADVEVSLILDVSGSMLRNRRIQNLRPAAREFVTTVLDNNTNAPNGLITISMIPYSAVVNVGTEIAPLMNITRSSFASTCPLFPDYNMFRTIELDLAQPYEHVSHFSLDSSPPSNNPWCFMGNDNAIVAHSSSETVLHNAIDALSPYGNTAIDMGVKWGAALLDPSTQPIVTGLMDNPANGIPAAAAGRPQAPADDVLKVIVLMTDGENTRQYDLRDPYKYGLSYIWVDMPDPGRSLRSISTSEFSIHAYGWSTPNDYSDDWFYWNGHRRVEPYPNGYSSRSEYVDAMNDGPVIDASPGQGPTYERDVRRTSWQELFSNWKSSQVNNLLLWNAYDDDVIPYSSSNPYRPQYRGADVAMETYLVDADTADDRLEELCAAARAKGIIIYTVAFEAPTRGQTALQTCATSTNHYFDVKGTDISDAFSSIASDIRALKLIH
ncbi:TadE/TadG family type IV pilus assembly protein [Thalassorhabdomicrobium marinisediminis]|uniref:TadE/TadG family type IV pilus assembly protein n=1 Tax=Thalassorhabdomicrobium marinisediminis TaxID=2170577 RepID=UPI00248F5106|nr:TadE/TadG family type IV pilus assembly protein [Thalassorhabdomicrobium marinisediminis]